MEMKGITPIIAIIILLLITIGLAATAYMFMMGFFGALTENSFIIQPNGVYCTCTDDSCKITAVVTNSGQDQIETDEWLINTFDGTSSGTLTAGGNLDKGSSITFTSPDLSKGSYTVHIGTNAGVEHKTVNCA